MWIYIVIVCFVGDSLPGSDEDSYSIDEVIKQNMTNIGASSVSLKILLNRLGH